jgi:hypothetical protein
MPRPESPCPSARGKRSCLLRIPSVYHPCASPMRMAPTPTYTPARRRAGAPQGNDTLAVSADRRAPTEENHPARCGVGPQRPRPGWQAGSGPGAKPHLGTAHRTLEREIPEAIPCTANGCTGQAPRAPRGLSSDWESAKTGSVGWRAWAQTPNRPAPPVSPDAAAAQSRIGITT